MLFIRSYFYTFCVGVEAFAFGETDNIFGVSGEFLFVVLDNACAFYKIIRA